MGSIVLSRRAQRGSRALIHRSRRNRDAPLCTVYRGFDRDAKESFVWLRIAEDETWSSSEASNVSSRPPRSLDVVGIIRRACQAQACQELST
jgi:hypothetical protein